jgi:hypothetical protein
LIPLDHIFVFVSRQGFGTHARLHTVNMPTVCPPVDNAMIDPFIQPFLGHLDAAVPKQHRHLIDGNSHQQQLHGKGIAKHLRVATFAAAVDF